MSQGGKRHVSRSSTSRGFSVGFTSISSGELSTLTTCNCEIAVLPLELLIQLQGNYFEKTENELKIQNHFGGYNVFCEKSVVLDGKQYELENIMERFIVIKSHKDYKDFRENLLTKPLILFTKAWRMKTVLLNCENNGKTFAIIVNTRHPVIRYEIENGLNNIISSVWGESYDLQFDFVETIKEFFAKTGYDTNGKGLSFSFRFKADAFFDLSYMLGFSSKKVPVSGKVLNLFSSIEEKKNKVKMFLEKISEPYIKRTSVSDRRMSSLSTGSVDDDVFSGSPSTTHPRASLVGPGPFPAIYE
ncbi:mesenteric estrogen-dependent adipogenesis protein-like [Erpetoichthys calabaricus]|uniref:Mesenteric estrogen dependent adiposis n=1 Tax=Erpetoichthys calabaricus TaxID=27687 RepID=A0A8C4RQN1_ERPCA|nr:mesenteric estrogen-dependent adipogenesis protein-like [Erpetoichthys calabaricus]